MIKLGAFKPSQYRKLAQCLKEQGFEICSLSGVEVWDDVWSNSEDIYEELRMSLSRNRQKNGSSYWISGYSR